MTPVEDQQLGGVIMWVPASLVYLGAGLTMFGAWMKCERDACERPLEFRKNLCELNAWPQPASRRWWSGDALREHLKLRRAWRGHSIWLRFMPYDSGGAGRERKGGPSLASFGKQQYVAGELNNTPDNLVRWIQHPRSVNEKTVMPELGVTAEDARDISALLYSLK